MAIENKTIFLNKTSQPQNETLYSNTTTTTNTFRVKSY